VSGTPAARLRILDRYWKGLVGEAWEQLCRHRMPWLVHAQLGEAGTWAPALRWWQGEAPEWDIVAEDIGGRRILLGEAKIGLRDIRRGAAEVASRPAPEFPAALRRHTVVRALFVPETQRVTDVGGVAIVTLRHLTRER
jgi:hypothetical protein